jgi:hypothetical protein
MPLCPLHTYNQRNLYEEDLKEFNDCCFFCLENFSNDERLTNESNIGRLSCCKAFIHISCLEKFCASSADKTKIPCGKCRQNIVSSSDLTYDDCIDEMADIFLLHPKFVNEEYYINWCLRVRESGIKKVTEIMAERKKLTTILSDSKNYPLIEKQIKDELRKNAVLFQKVRYSPMTRLTNCDTFIKK